MDISHRTVALSLGIVLAGLALTGCSVSVSGPASTPDTSSTAPTGAAGASRGAATPETSAGQVDTSTGIVDDERMAKLQRSRWTGSVSQHLVCSGDDLTLDHNLDAMIVELTGDCDDVTIVADAGIVLLPAVQELTIEGDGAIVIVASAEEITLSAAADANLVGWESGSPEVHNSGTLNGTTPIR